MPVNLSIKNVPDEVAERLRSRAALNHRSLQRELLSLVEQAALPGSRAGGALVAREPEARYTVTKPPTAPVVADDGLLQALDAVVAGSRWASAPLLTREQLHDRTLSREIDFDARNAQR